MRHHAAVERLGPATRLPPLELQDPVGPVCKLNLTAPQAREILSRRRPRDSAGKTCERLALEQLEDLTVIDRKIKASDKELKAMVIRAGSKLMELPGIGPIGAARTASRPGPEQRPWTHPPASRSATGSLAPATARSTACCTWPHSARSASIPRAAPTIDASVPPARPTSKPCDA